MTRRKTIELRKLVDLVNDMNMAPSLPKDTRQGANTLLEQALHLSGQYQGFRYLTSNDLPESVEPGIVGQEENGKYIFGDESRRQYFYQS